jgi:hypothetical protein
MCSASDTCFSLTFTLFRLTKLFVVPFINSTCTSPVNSNGISPPFPLVQTKEFYGTPLVCKCISFVLCLIPGIISFIEFGAGPSGGALWGLDWIAWCWGRGFRSCLRHGFLSLSFCVVLSCVGTGLASGWSKKTYWLSKLFIISESNSDLEQVTRNNPYSWRRRITFRSVRAFVLVS